MGSRKRKINLRKNGSYKAFLRAYRSLAINEKIAFKCFIYWHGRQRLTLDGMLKIAPDRHFTDIFMQAFFNQDFTYWLSIH
jgi:hypothetical protein